MSPDATSTEAGSLDDEARATALHGGLVSIGQCWPVSRLPVSSVIPLPGPSRAKLGSFAISRSECVEVNSLTLCQ